MAVIDVSPVSVRAEADHRPGAARTDQARSTLLARAAVILGLAAALALGLAPVLTDSAIVPASAPSTEFSGERAMSDLRAIASTPHPMGSPEHEAAVAYIVQQLRDLGLQPEVQTTSAAGPPQFYAHEPVAAGRVENILARMPGTASSGAILLIGNYDSMPTTPGAGDPDTSAAVVLETVRALRAGPPLRNDVIAAFIDVDPNGLIGDQAFVTEHPWANDVGFAMSFANLGIHGPVAIETTTRSTVRFVEDILRVAPHPSAYSSLTAVTRAMGDTGPLLWAAAANNKPGVEFVAFNSPQAYHTMLSTPDRLDPGQVQQHGSYALSLARYFGNLTLDQPAGTDLVFFNIAPDRLIAYPSAWTGPLAMAIAALGIGVVIVGLRRRRLSWRGLGVGFLAFPIVTVTAAALMAAGWSAITTLNPSARVFLLSGPYNAATYQVGLVVVGLALVSGAYALLGRWRGTTNLMTGAFAWIAALMTLTSLAMPGMSYLFMWPLLASVLVLGWMFLAPAAAARPWPRAVALIVSAAPALVLVAAPIAILFALVSRLGQFVAVVFALAAVGMVLLVPALDFLNGSRRWVFPTVAAASGALVLGFGLLTSGFSADQPRPDSIAYVLDADSGTASWVSADEQLDTWTSQFFPSGAQAGTFVPFPNAMPDRVFPALQALAPTVDLAPPRVSVLGDRVIGNQRSLGLQVTSPRGAPNVYLDLQSGGDIAATLDGKPLDLSAIPVGQRSRLRLTYHAIPVHGFQLDVTISAGRPVHVRVEDRSNGLPAIPGLDITPRPADTMLAPFEMADPTVVAASFVLE